MNCIHCQRFFLACKYCYKILDLVSITHYSEIIADYDLVEYLKFKLND